MSNLVRWDPFGRLMSWPDIVRHMFESSLVRPSLLEPFGPDLALDMYETGDSVVVKVAVPGVKPDEIEVSVVGDTLTIRGETKVEEDVEEQSYIRRERRYGKFSRTITLPTRLETDKAEAEFENGILVLTLPKAEEVKPKSIQVKVK